MENEFDVLGFDPGMLSSFNAEKPKSESNPLIYKTKPAESKSEDGIYRATIKLIYNPFDLRNSVIEQQSYSMTDKNGWFNVVSSLTVNDTNCPIFKAWKKCRYAEEKSTLWLQQAGADQGGRHLFDKRFARYVTIQVLEDENQPELVGKYLFWKLPKSIWEIVSSKMNPTDEKKASIPVMDFLFGKALELEVIPGPDDPKAPERKTRETSYRGELTEDCVSVINPDGSAILSDDEQDILDDYINAMKKVWKSRNPEERAELAKEVAAQDNTKALKKIYSKVLDQIKQVCPNIVEHLGYKELDEATKARVDNWIATVLAGNDPATYDPNSSAVVAGTAATSNAAKPTGGSEDVAPASTAAVETADEDDELPF